MIAPANSIVVLPDNISFQEAARFGYLGTAYSALRKGRAGPNVATLINGGSGTLGLGAVLLALAMGVTKILAVARNPEVLEDVRKLQPSRILVHSVQVGPIHPGAYQGPDGHGVYSVIDGLTTGGRRVGQ